MPKNKKRNITIFDALKKRLGSQGLKETFRRSKSDFTRERKMPFKKVVLFMMNLSRRSLQIELTGFMRSFADGVQNVTGSAFNQNRKKIDPLLFRDLLEVLNTEFYTDNEERVRLWEGMRLLATDGSIMSLPQTDELRELYGGSSNQHGQRVVNARSSVLYDVLNKMVLHGVLSTYHVGERELAKQHLPHCGKGDLIIYDRGYPGYSLMAAVVERGAEFLMRCTHTFNGQVEEFLASGLMSRTVLMEAGKNARPGRGTKQSDRVTVRMVKVLLDNGEVEALLTSLVDEARFPTAVFKELYKQRWGVERFYDVVKNIARVENFTGHKDQVIQQDFHCAMLMCNIHSLLVSEAEEEMPTRPLGRKYAYKVNNNTSFGFMKNAIVRILVEEDSEQMMASLKELFLSNTIPIRPGRHFPRDRDKYRNKTRPEYIQNSKPAL